MKIKEVSVKFNLSADTLRYYEKIGLTPTIARNNNGVRQYNEDDLKMIEFIKCMRTAGLPIEVLIHYISLFKEGPHTSEERKKILQDQRDKLKEKIKMMQTTLDRLNKKIESYDDAFFKIEHALIANKADE